MSFIKNIGLKMFLGLAELTAMQALFQQQHLEVSMKVRNFESILTLVSFYMGDN